MVLQFVGFLGAFRDAGWESALLAGTLGGSLATFVTLVPCFASILLRAPYMERLRANPALSSALTAVTAAVVGVILNLAIWFAIHVIWREFARIERSRSRIELPVLGSTDWAAAVFVVNRARRRVPPQARHDGGARRRTYSWGSLCIFLALSSAADSAARAIENERESRARQL